MPTRIVSQFTNNLRHRPLGMEKFNRSKPATANLGRSARTHERNPCQGT